MLHVRRSRPHLRWRGRKCAAMGWWSVSLSSLFGNSGRTGDPGPKMMKFRFVPWRWDIEKNLAQAWRAHPWNSFGRSTAHRTASVEEERVIGRYHDVRSITTRRTYYPILTARAFKGREFMSLSKFIRNPNREMSFMTYRATNFNLFPIRFPQKNFSTSCMKALKDTHHVLAHQSWNQYIEQIDPPKWESKKYTYNK